MATIKDVASLAGVSTSTVSFVLNGKAKEMKVSDITAQKVMEAAAKLKYKPSSTARKLRSSTKERPTIALYWPMDHRISYASLILDSIRTEVNRQGLDCDLVIRGYRNDYLCEQKELLDQSNYNVAIIGATSAKDSEYIESLSPVLPLILFNRSSRQFSSVLAEEETAIRDAVSLISDKGIRKVALFRGNHSYTAYDRRMEILRNTLDEYNILLPEEFDFRIEDRYESGASAARRMLQMESRPELLIAMTETISLGATYIFEREGIQIPDELKILSFAIGDPNITKFCTPSLSVIEMSTIDMAEHAAAMAIHRIRTGISAAPESHQSRNRLILRESCPE